MRAIDIVDEASMKRWLESRPKDTVRRDAVGMAHRAALRLFPLWAAQLASDRSLLQILWCLISSGNSLEINDAVIRKAVLNSEFVAARTSAAASSAAKCLTIELSEVAGVSAFGVASAAAVANSAYAATAVWKAAARDASTVGLRRDYRLVRLWDKDIPQKLLEYETDFLSRWSQSPATWDFWRRWWNGARDGKPLDWELQKRVALIPVEDWENNNPAHIAALIHQIEKAWNAENLATQRIEEIIAETPDDEEIVQDPKTGKLVSIPRPAIPEDLFASILDRLSTAMRRLRRDLTSNPTDNAGQILIGRLDVPLKDLKADLRNYAGRPLDTHDAIDQCRAAFIGQLTDCGMADDWRMQRFVGLLDTCLSDIRRNDAVVLDIVQKREDDRFARMGAENQRLYLELCAEMAKDSAGFLKKTMLAQIDLSLDEAADPEQRKAARYALRARLPRGAKAVQNLNKDHAELSAARGTRAAGQSGAGVKATVKTTVGVLDGVHKVDAGGKAIGDWATRVYTEAASGHFFGLRDWLN